MRTLNYPTHRVNRRFVHGLGGICVACLAGAAPNVNGNGATSCVRTFVALPFLVRARFGIHTQRYFSTLQNARLATLLLRLRRRVPVYNNRSRPPARMRDAQKLTRALTYLCPLFPVSFLRLRNQHVQRGQRWLLHALPCQQRTAVHDILDVHLQHRLRQQWPNRLATIV